MGIDGFNEALARAYPDRAPSQADAAEAFRNLAGFLDLLIRVNERERLVPIDATPGSHAKEGRRAGQ